LVFFWGFYQLVNGLHEISSQHVADEGITLSMRNVVLAETGLAEGL
jgi:hypothetical protein